jgi:predicted flap endonuclease-1-like 5' DNA nuclease
MPAVSVLQIILITVAIIAGVVIGWLGRGKRCGQEKSAIGASWQEQLDAQRSEQKRLAGQNRSLMDQVSHYQASQNDAGNRARELSGALKEAFARRDQLQRETKDIRHNLESALAECRRLDGSIHSLSDENRAYASAVKEKDDKIFQLSRELDSWHTRLPPLIERFRERDADARRLQDEIGVAAERIGTLESMLANDQTHVDTINPAQFAEDFDASNDTLASTLGPTSSERFQDALNGARRDYEQEERPQPASDAITADIAAANSSAAGDDLQAIKGVGPAIEKTLHELGIYRFGQIAEMSEYDIDRVARRLKGFRSRIYREDWIGQARDLRDRRPHENV